MSERKYWCECMWDLINYHKNIDRAKGILQWSADKGYKQVTSGAEAALKDSLKNIQDTMKRCDWYPEGNEQAQRNIHNAVSTTPKEALKLVSEAEYTFRTGLSNQCRIESKIMFEETKPERERKMQEQREAIRRR